MKKLYEYLDIIKRRPGMYLGEIKISLLRADIGGFTFFSHFNNLDIGEHPNFSLFHEYIGIVYGMKSIGGMGWSTILKQEYGDGKDGVDKFFEHLDDFKELFGDMSQEEIIKWFDERGYDVRSRFHEKY